MTCSFNISLKLQAEFLEHLTMEPSPERYLLITLIATIVTEAKILQKIVNIIECKIEFSLKHESGELESDVGEDVPKHMCQKFQDSNA